MNKEQKTSQTTEPAIAVDTVLAPVHIEDKKPYCTDCGNDDLAYIDQYANGEYWKCKECGKQFIW